MVSKLILLQTDKFWMHTHYSLFPQDLLHKQSAGSGLATSSSQQYSRQYCYVGTRRGSGHCAEEQQAWPGSCASTFTGALLPWLLASWRENLQDKPISVIIMICFIMPLQSNLNPLCAVLDNAAVPAKLAGSRGVVCVRAAGGALWERRVGGHWSVGHFSRLSRLGAMQKKQSPLCSFRQLFQYFSKSAKFDLDVTRRKLGSGQEAARECFDVSSGQRAFIFVGKQNCVVSMQLCT